MKVKIGDFLHRIKRPVTLEPEMLYKLVTIKLYHNGVILREQKKGKDIGSAMHEVKAGDFILSGIDARNGAFGIVPDELDGAIVTNDFWYFQLDESVISKELFLNLTKTTWFDEICRKGSDGTTQRIRLQKDKFFEQVIELPEVKSQKRLLKRLDSVQVLGSDLSTEITHQQDLLKKLRQQILQDAISGKLTAEWRQKNPHVEPASELLKRIQAEKAKLGIKQKPLPPIRKEEIPFELPEGWVWCRLGEITNIVRGGSPRPAGDKRFYDGSIPFLKVADLTKDEEMCLDTFSYSIKEAGLNRTRSVPAETLMLTNSGATLGVPKICTFPTTFNDGIAAFIDLSSDLSKEYLYFFLKAHTRYFLDFASRGQGQPNLNTDIIGMTILGLPTKVEQIEIVHNTQLALGSIMTVENNVSVASSNCNSLLQSILKEAFEA